MLRLRTTLALECTHEVVKQGRKLISKRQKLNQRAVCLEVEWSVVVECTADELACTPVCTSNNKK